MLVSVIVITRNEHERLRLALLSLAHQSVLRSDRPGRTSGADSQAEFEIIVVDDGGTDGTAEMIQALSSRVPVKLIRNSKSQGIASARNAGANAANGEVFIFLDGDVLASRRLVEKHASLHGDPGRKLVGRGETYHLRCTRFFQDPSTGTPMPGQESRVLMMKEQLKANLVTEEQVCSAFQEIESRAEAGIYPGGGPRRLYELEMELLHDIPDSSCSWMAASGHNLSVRREDFEAVGGYCDGLPTVEQREFALRVCERGGRVVPVSGARTYHLTHRTGVRDPFPDISAWEPRLYRSHPHPGSRLMILFWQSLAGDPDIPPESRILSLKQMHLILTEGREAQYELVRSRHPLLSKLSIEAELSSSA